MKLLISDTDLPHFDLGVTRVLLTRNTGGYKVASYINGPPDYGAREWAIDKGACRDYSMSVSTDRHPDRSAYPTSYGVTLADLELGLDVAELDGHGMILLFQPQPVAETFVIGMVFTQLLNWSIEFSKGTSKLSLLFKTRRELEPMVVTS